MIFSGTCTVEESQESSASTQWFPGSATSRGYVLPKSSRVRSMLSKDELFSMDTTTDTATSFALPMVAQGAKVRESRSVVFFWRDLSEIY